MIRYFYHPESDSFFTQDTTNDKSEPCEDGHVVELTKQEYESRTGSLPNKPWLAGNALLCLF